MNDRQRTFSLNIKRLQKGGVISLIRTRLCYIDIFDRRNSVGGYIFITPILKMSILGTLPSRMISSSGRISSIQEKSLEGKCFISSFFTES